MRPNPATQEVIPVLSAEYQVAANKGQCLIFDSGVGDQERIFIFASEIGLQSLAESKHWYADGTFRTCPEIIFQLHTVHVQKLDSIFPCFLFITEQNGNKVYENI